MVTGSNCPSLEEHRGNCESSHPTARGLTLRSPWRQEEEGCAAKRIWENHRTPLRGIRYRLPKGLNHLRNITKRKRIMLAETHFNDLGDAHIFLLSNYLRMKLRVQVTVNNRLFDI